MPEPWREGGSHRIDVEGVDLHVEIAGEGDPVLMIHGNGADAAAFAPMTAHLVGRRRVLAYDRRSFSRSEAPPLSDVGRHARDAAALLEKLDAAPATVVGWSSGGVVALHLALERPDLVERLVLAEPSLLVRAPTPSLLGAMARCHLLRLLRGPEEAAVAFYRWVSAYRNERDGEDNAFDTFPDDVRSRMRANAASTFAEMRPGGGSGGEHLSRHTLASVRCPVTLVRGGRSQPVFRKALGFAARHLPDASTVELPSASHAIPTDCPRELAGIVAEENPSRVA